MTVVEIPLTPEPQTFSITLGGTSYRLRLTWDEAINGFWALDIAQDDGALLLAGLPLVTGADILAQHACLNFGGKLIVTTDRDIGEVPTYASLGTASHLYFVTAN